MASSSDRQDLERRAAAKIELERRRREAINSKTTVFGIFRPNGQYGGEHLRSWHNVNGKWLETDEPCRVTIPERLECLLWAEQRFIVLFGGRGGAKSQTVSDILAALAHDKGDKALCLREYQNSIEDSVHSLLKAEIERLGYDRFSVGKNTIGIGSRDFFRFKGLARDPNAVKSAFGFRTGWVEEAQSLSKDSITKLTPTFRTAGSRLIFTMNPDSSEDPMSKRFLKPYQADLDRNGIYQDDLHLIIKINYSDNPWHGELEKERVYDLEHKTAAEYRHIWEGDHYDEVDGGIIALEWFEAAIDAHIKLGITPRGARIVAHDPSDQGKDAKGIAVMHGIVITDCQEGVDRNGVPMDVNEGMDWALEIAHEARADHFVWDVDGLGAGLRRQVTDTLSKTAISFSEFRGGASVRDPDVPVDDGTQRTHGDTYPNRRSQEYIELSERFRNTWRAVVRKQYIDPDTLISISSDIDAIDKLRSELCRIPGKRNSRGMRQVMSKVEMAQKLKLASPNMADSVMMAVAAAHDISHSDWGDDLEYNLAWVV